MTEPEQYDAAKIFSAADLIPENCRGEPFEIPGTGKQVWVFPPTPADFGALVDFRYREEKLGKPKTPAEKAQFLRKLYLFQVVRATRQGPNLAAALCFSEADIPAMQELFPAAVIASIVKISEGETVTVPEYEAEAS